MLCEVCLWLGKPHIKTRSVALSDILSADAMVFPATASGMPAVPRLYLGLPVKLNGFQRPTYLPIVTNTKVFFFFFHCLVVIDIDLRALARFSGSQISSERKHLNLGRSAPK